jgi:2-methylcitrate dehydratase PrpD
VAIALADGRVDQASFDANARGRLAAERAKVEVALSPEIDVRYPQNWGAELVVETADGRKLSGIRRDARGDPENPVTAEELSVKARAAMVKGGMTGTDADRLIATILDLTNDRPVRDLGLFPRSGPNRAAPRLARSA